MRRTVLSAILLGLFFAFPAIAQAQIVAKINLSHQRMSVFVNGAERYSWPVSTARPGYRTPVGTFKPTALVRYHRSTIYSGSPMPYSIFFLRWQAWPCGPPCSGAASTPTPRSATRLGPTPPSCWERPCIATALRRSSANGLTTPSSFTKAAGSAT
jgi:hypothetical protein